MEQHPVPQHIASFKFKIFGNLTARQFFTLLIPASIATLVYFSNLPFIFKAPLVVIFGGFGLFITFVPIGGMPFDKWIVAFIKAIALPTQRVWIKEKEYPEFLNIISTPVKIIPKETPYAQLSKQRRERLLAYVKTLPRDTVSPLDIKEKIALGNIDFSIEPAFISAESLSHEQFPPPIIWPTQGWREPPATLEKVTLEPNLPIIPEEKIPLYQEPKISHYAKPYVVSGLEKRLSKKKPERRPVDITRPFLNLASDTNYWIDNIIPIITPGNKVQLLHGIGKTRARKLHFAPPENFDLSKLPIRGEKRFNISEELKKRFLDTSPQVILPFERTPEPLSEITKSIPKPKRAPIPQTQHASIKHSGSQTQVQETATQDASKFAITDVKETQSNQAVSPGATIIPLTSTPNVISGLVTDYQGAPIPAAVLIVRDESGIPVRALKTNKLGQFLSATPLSSGKYTIETESDLAKFKPVSIEAYDKIIAAIQITSEQTQNAKN